MNAETTCSTSAAASDESGCTALRAAEGDEPEQPPPAPREQAQQIELTNRTAAGLDAAWLRRQMVAAATHVGTPVHRIGLVVVGDEAMAALHAEHHGDPTTTDVLTFPMSDPGEPIDVDIVVCADEAARQAGPRRHTVERELLLYGLHGLLHCAGFDDTTAEAYERMHRREDEILQSIGVGATFRDDGEVAS